MLRLIRPSPSSMPEMVLRGAQVYLRPPQDRDWSAWADVRRASRAFLEPWEPTWPSDALTRDYYRRRVRQQAQDWRDDAGYSFFIFRAADDALVGGINMTNVRRGVAQMASLGYWVGEAYARQGNMSAGIACVAHFAFDRLGLHRLEAACLPANDASAGVLRKAGFTEEGYARRYLRINGKWEDHLLFALLDDDKRPEGVVVLE